MRKILRNCWRGSRANELFAAEICSGYTLEELFRTYVQKRAKSPVATPLHNRKKRDSGQISRDFLTGCKALIPNGLQPVFSGKTGTVLLDCAKIGRQIAEYTLNYTGRLDL